MRQYIRQLRLFLGNDNESIEINSLRVDFEIIKTQTSEPNPSIIRVYNLSRDNQAKITAKTFKKVVLAVGYEDVRVIYGGDIIESKTVRDDLDTIIEMECGDGFVDYSSAYVAVTLKAGATDSDIVKELTKTMPNTDVGTIDLPNVRKLPRGRVLVGNTREILDKIAVNNNANWSIQDGTLHIVPKGKVLADNEGFVLSQDTGLIGFPEKTNEGLQVNCLLNPALKIGGLVRVESILPQFNGDFKITELKHVGDNMTEDWRSEIICVGGEFQKIEKADKGKANAAEK